MINDDGCIRYNHIDKSLLGTVKTAWFESKKQLQRIELTTTLRIDNKNITDELRKAVSEDSFAIRLIKQLKTESVEGFVVIKDLLTFQGKVYIPRKFRSKFLKLCHAEPESGHFGEQKTRERLATRYYFPKLRKEVTDFIAKCDLCHRTKHESLY